MECRFHLSENSVTVQTIVHHDQEETVVVRLETIDTGLQYAATDEQISNLKQVNTCSQSIGVRCHYTYFSMDIMWTGDNGTEVHSTVGEQTEGCSCPFVNKCEEGKTT